MPPPRPRLRLLPLPPVILQVNGENSAFMRILKDDDDILIREEDTPRA